MRIGLISFSRSFSLLLAELMIGTLVAGAVPGPVLPFQSPISGVNDWNKRSVG